MEIKQIRRFIAIAEEGSLSAASSRLGVAQPSLSQLLKTMETQIGVQLVSRSPQGVQLTSAGTALLERGRRIVQLVDQSQEEVRLIGREAVGSVSCGLPSSVSMVLSVPLAETARVVMPKVSLKVAEAMSGFIRRWLDEGTIDIGVLYDIDRPGDYQSELLLAEDLHFFSGADNWPKGFARNEPVKLANIAELDLILPTTDHGLRQMIDRYCKARGVSLNVVIEMDALAQIKTLVARGSGYCILAPAAAYDMVADGQLVSTPIAEPVMRRPVYLVRSSCRPLTRATMEIEQLLKEVVTDLVRRRIWLASLSDPADGPPGGIG